jgi:Flp pilus assembly protein TadG
MKRTIDMRLKSLWNRISRQTSEGQILVMFAAGIVLLLGMVAVAVDTGFLMAERRQVQNAADAGALAAAKAKLDYMYQGSEAELESSQVQAGETYASRNAGVTPDDISVDTAPEGYGDEYVEVTVSKDVDMFFLRALYDGEWGTSASAIAGIDDVQLPYALVALDCPGITVSGSGTINVNEGSIMSNCNIIRDGQSNIVTAEGAIDANGTIDQGGQWYAGQGFREGRTPLTDPIAEQGIQPPNRDQAKALRQVTTQDQLHQAVTNSAKHQSNTVRCTSNSPACVMQPGYYGGNLTLDVRNNGTLRLAPGYYYFGENFRLELTGGEQSPGTVRGTDVMMFFTDNSRFVPGNGRVNISSPDSSPYMGGLDGMALWIDNCSSFRMQANNSGTFSGVVYAPCSDVMLSGGPGAQGFQVIVGSLTLSGSGGFDIQYEEYVLFDTPGVFLVR